MPDRDALKAEIAKPDYAKMSNAEIAAAINPRMVPGPPQDVALGDVAGVFLQRGCFVPLQQFSQGKPIGDVTHDAALQVAQTFVAWMGLGSNAPVFRCSLPDIYAEAQQMLAALQAQETAAKGTTGITPEIADAVLALAQTKVPLYQSFFTDEPPRPLDHADILAAKGERWEDYVTIDPGKPHEHAPDLVAAKRAAYEAALDDKTGFEKAKQTAYDTALAAAKAASDLNPNIAGSAAAAGITQLSFAQAAADAVVKA